MWDYWDGWDFGNGVISNDGTSFNDVEDAAAAYDCDPDHIIACCEGRRECAGGMEWMYT